MPTPKKQIQNFNKELDKLLEKVTDRKSMIQYAKLAIGAIHDRTRSKGQGLKANGGTPRKFKKVTEKYAKRRKKMKNKHPEAATGRDSNLTLTGRMLDTMKVIRSRNKEAEIGWSIKKERDKAAGNEERGRPFLALSTKEIKLISKLLDKKLSREAKKV